MNYKNIREHKEWMKLAKRADDLQYVLLTYGKQFSPSVLKAVRKNFKTVNKKCEKLTNKLYEQGWRDFC